MTKRQSPRLASRRADADGAKKRGASKAATTRRPAQARIVRSGLTLPRALDAMHSIIELRDPPAVCRCVQQILVDGGGLLAEMSAEEERLEAAGWPATKPTSLVALLNACAARRLPIQCLARALFPFEGLKHCDLGSRKVLLKDLSETVPLDSVPTEGGLRDWVPGRDKDGDE